MSRPAALVLGVGNVGAGIAEALDEAGYAITAIDPSDTLKPGCRSRSTVLRVLCVCLVVRIHVGSSGSTELADCPPSVPQHPPR